MGIFNRLHRRTTNRRKPRSRAYDRPLRIEQLEDRRLLAAVGERQPDVPDYVGDIFAAAYNRVLNWGSPNCLYLDECRGQAVNKVHRWGPGFIQDFSGGRFDEGAGAAIMMLESSDTAYVIWGKHWELFKQQPMQATNPPTSGMQWLGYPTTDHRNPSSGEANGLTWYENGSPPADLTQAAVINLEAGYITYRVGDSFAWWTKNGGVPVRIGEPAPAVPTSVTAKFQDAYHRVLNWGERNSVYLAQPINTVYRWGEGWIQDFRGGRYGDGAIMLVDNASTAYAIWGDHWQLYKQSPMQGTNPPSSGRELLGYPTSDHRNPTVDEAKGLVWFEYGTPPLDLTEGSFVRFQRGNITWKANTAHAWWSGAALIGERDADVPSTATTKFQDAYQRVLEWGERNAIYLGMPINSVHRWGDGWIQDFRGGRYDEGAGAAIMLRDGSTTAFAIWGKHWELYRQQPMQGTHPATSGRDWLGFPISDHHYVSDEDFDKFRWFESGPPPMRTEDGAIVEFEKGYITWKSGTPFAWWTRNVRTLTVVTHGLDTFTDQRPWVNSLAQSLSESTDPQQGRRHYWMPFYWDAGLGSLGSADDEVADALFDDLFNGIRDTRPGNWAGLTTVSEPVNIHFVGHSRGAYVIAEVTRRLQKYFDNNPNTFYNEIGTIQVTTLDPQFYGPDGRLDFPCVVVTSGGVWSYYQTTPGAQFDLGSEQVTTSCVEGLPRRPARFLNFNVDSEIADMPGAGNFIQDHGNVGTWYADWIDNYGDRLKERQPNELAPYFHLAFRRGTETRLLLDSPPTMILPGERTKTTLAVNPSSSRLTIAVAYAGSDLDLELVAPDGSRITHATLPSTAELVEGPTYEYYTISAPTAGEWQVETIAIDVPTEGEPFILTASTDSAVEPSPIVISEVFESAGSFELNGSAEFLNGVLRLTNDTYQGGSVWFDQLLSSNRFTATFDFQVTQQGGIGWGDGFTFAVADADVTSQTAVGDLGIGLGYAGLSGFAVEFDTYDNFEHDPGYVHVGLDINGSVDSIAESAPLAFDIRDTGFVTAIIDYDHGVLTVSLGKNGESPMTVLSAMVPAGANPISKRIGFTGSTASAWQTVLIDDFRLELSPVSASIQFEIEAVIYPNHFTQPGGQASDTAIATFRDQVEATLDTFLNQLRVASNGILDGRYNISVDDRVITRDDYDELDFGNGDNWLVLQGDTIDTMLAEDFSSPDAAYAFVMWGNDPSVSTANFYHGNNFISMAGAWQGAAIHEFMHLLDDEFHQATEPGMVHADDLADFTKYECITTPESHPGGELQWEDVPLIQNILAYHDSCDGRLLDYLLLKDRFGTFVGVSPQTILNPVAQLTDNDAPTVANFTPIVVPRVPLELSSVTFSFSEPLDAGSVSLADVVSFKDPSGNDLRSQLTAITIAGTDVTVRFATQSVAGNYEMVVGPDVRDLAGNLMDQDGDGIAGEEVDDRFVATVRVNTPPVAVEDIAITNEDTQIVVDVVINDTDADGADGDFDFTTTITTSPMHGTAELDFIGKIIYTPNLNYFGTDIIGYTVRDHDGATSQEGTVSLTVLSVNDPPTAIELDNVIVSENAPGAVVGNFIVSDVDTTDTHTFVVSDNRFEIAAGQLKLKAGQSLDFEATPSISLDITATDAGGLAFTKSFTITVTNVNEVPTSIVLSANTVAENAAGAVIGGVTVTDPDASDTHSFVVSDNRFEIAARQLKLKASQSLDFEVTPSVNLDITATDGGGLPITLSFTINVTNVNDAPQAISLTNATAKENTPGIVLGELVVTDEDAGDSHTLTVSHDEFELDGDVLRLKEGRSLVYDEDDPITLISVTAVDAGGLGYTEQIAIVVLAHPLPWQNEAITADADDDGFVSPVDALVIINYINQFGSEKLPVPPPVTIVFYYDTSGDGEISPIDVLLVINLLNTSGEGENSPRRGLVPMNALVNMSSSPRDITPRRPDSRNTPTDSFGDWPRVASERPRQSIAAEGEATDFDSADVDRLIDELLAPQPLVELDELFADWATS